MSFYDDTVQAQGEDGTKEDAEEKDEDIDAPKDEPSVEEASSAEGE